LGAALWYEGEFQQARPILEENLRAAHESDRSAVTTTLSILARVLVDMGQRAAALDSAVALEAAIRAVGGWFYEYFVPDVRGSHTVGRSVTRQPRCITMIKSSAVWYCGWTSRWATSSSRLTRSAR